MDFTLPVEKFQKKINDKFSKFRYDKAKMKDACNIKKGSKVTLSKSQEFISNYFTPKNPNGIFLYHSVGAGKTLTAIAALAKFESRGFNTLWVTRASLKKDLQKGLDMLPLKNPLMTLSYKQFSNIYKKTGENYRKLIKRAKKINPGTNDPLYKTILVIDEAHKLYTKDLKAQEFHNIKSIENMIFTSYSTSKENKVKVMLMSATPITENPLEMINLLNLLISNEKSRFNVGGFNNMFFDVDGDINKSNRGIFLEKIKGLVSYLDVSKNPSQFASIEIEDILVPASISPDLADMKGRCSKNYKACRSLGISTSICRKSKNDCDKEVKEDKQLSKESFQNTISSKRCGIKI